MTRMATQRKQGAHLIAGRGVTESWSTVIVLGSALGAAAFGLAVPVSPWDAVAVLLLILLGLAAPTAAVGIILAITLLVPWNLQDQFQIFGGGPGERGVSFVDALLLVALVRTGWMVIRRRIDFDVPMLLGTIVSGALVAATLWGMARGANVSDAANEGRRVLFASGTFLLAWPLLRDVAARRVIMRWLVGIGLALAIWGLVQYLFDVGYTGTGDVGVRGGLASKQLQGGMYAYPVVVIIAWAALVTGAARTTRDKVLSGAVLALNTVCVMLTLERTLVLASALGCGFVVIVAGARAGGPALKWGAGMVGLLVMGAVVAQTHTRSALDRMALIGDLGSDNSYTHRIIEANLVGGQIADHPILGSGFGAAVSWAGQNKFASGTTTFADLGYHWLAWKVGLPLAALIVVLILLAVFRRTRGFEGADWHALRMGARGALLALLVIAVLFGVFNALNITAAIGLLVAVCFSARNPNQESTSDVVAKGMETAR